MTNLFFQMIRNNIKWLIAVETCGCQSASMSVSSLQPSKIPLEQRTAKIALIWIKIMMITMMRIKMKMITMMRIKIMMIMMILR